MKPVRRIGVFFIILASSLFLVAIYRSSPIVSGPGVHLPSDEWKETSLFVWPPKDVRIMFSTAGGQEISLYLLNAQGLNEWKTTEKLNPLLSFENVSTGIHTYSIPSRDRYTFVIYSQNETHIEIDLTLYGFEKDLLLTVEVLMISGLALTVVPFIFEKITLHQFHRVEED